MRHIGMPIDGRYIWRCISFFILLVDETLKLWSPIKKKKLKKKKLLPTFYFLQRHKEHSGPCCATTRRYPDMLSWICPLHHNCIPWPQCEEQINLLNLFLTYAGKSPFSKSSLTNSPLPICATMCRGVHPMSSPCSIVDGHFSITFSTSWEDIGKQYCSG